VLTNVCMTTQFSLFIQLGFATRYPFFLGAKFGLDTKIDHSEGFKLRSVKSGPPALEISPPHGLYLNVTTRKSTQIPRMIQITSATFRLLHSCFVFGRSRVKIWVRRPAILRVFMIFLSPSTKQQDMALKLDHDRFLPNPFQFIIHLPPFHSTPLS
jgi:hypothetical protein